MLLDSDDLEFLKLCGVSRFLPRKLAEKYSLPMFSVGLAETLADSKLIKEVSAECKCYRLTSRGRDLLKQLGYCFSDDARMPKKGSTFKRRIVNADLNIMMYSAGTDIFAGTMQGMAEADNTYIPSLTERACTKSRFLAGTKFYGIIRKKETAYVFYHADVRTNGIYPDYEQQAFFNILRGIDTVKNIAIVLADETLQGLVNTVFSNEQQKLQQGLVPFSDILERWSYDVYLFPINTDGIIQLNLLGRNYIREKIARDFSDIKPDRELNACDGMSEGMSYVVGLDMNISRVARALEQSLYMDLTPNIICLPHQCGVYKAMAVKASFPKQIKFKVINQNKLIERFPELIHTFAPVKPVQSRDGGYVKV